MFDHFVGLALKGLSNIKICEKGQEGYLFEYGALLRQYSLLIKFVKVFRKEILKRLFSSKDPFLNRCNLSAVVMKLN